jgi:hypothetical protein
MNHIHLLLSKGPAGEAWKSSNKAMLFQKFEVLEREVLSFFSAFRDFKELGLCNFLASDHTSLKTIGFCGSDIQSHKKVPYILHMLKMVYT